MSENSSHIIKRYAIEFLNELPAFAICYFTHCNSGGLITSSRNYKQSISERGDQWIQKVQAISLIQLLFGYSNFLTQN